MSREIARAIVEDRLKVLRKLSYGELAKLVGRISCDRITRPDGEEYQVETEARWDGKTGGDISDRCRRRSRSQRLMRTGLAAIASIWLTGLVVGSAQAEPFTFAGFHRNMNLADLVDRYPSASHEVTPGADVRKMTSQEDPKEWNREFFRTRGSGQHVLRLTPGESHDHLYYVQAWVRQGTTERLWLLFEKPLDLVRNRGSTGSNEARYPACNDVLKPLMAKYGKPDALAPRWEEALQSFDYVWTHLSDVMTLECGRYLGRKSVFAIGVTFEQAAPR